MIFNKKHKNQTKKQTSILQALVRFFLCSSFSLSDRHIPKLIFEELLLQTRDLWWQHF